MIKAAESVPNAGGSVRERKGACEVDDPQAAWERFREGVRVTVSVPKEVVDDVKDAEQTERAKVREGRK